MLLVGDGVPGHVHGVVEWAGSRKVGLSQQEPQRHSLYLPCLGPVTFEGSLAQEVLLMGVGDCRFFPVSWDPCAFKGVPTIWCKGRVASSDRATFGVIPPCQSNQAGASDAVFEAIPLYSDV